MRSLAQHLVVFLTVTACGEGHVDPTPDAASAASDAGVTADSAPPPRDAMPRDATLPPRDVGPLPAPEGLSLRADPAFDPAGLSAEERLWYDRLQASIAASWDTATERAGSNDTYLLGRYVGDYIASLLIALRATGDASLLEPVAELSDLYRADLQDAWSDGTTDGYIGWWWQADAGTYFGNDTHQMDEAMTHGNVALVAYAFHVNRDLGYGERADFWIDYLENQFLAKWEVRAGGREEAWGSSGFYKRLTHPRSNQLRLAYYLWRLTGDDFYRARAEEIATELLAHVEDNPGYPGAYRWKHQVAGNDEGWQRINYAQYFMRVVVEMHLEGFLGYADTSEMRGYATTFRDAVLDRFGAPWSEMAYRVDGSESTGTSIYGLSAFGRWDDTGTILRIADARYGDGSAGVSNAANALLAVSER